MSGARMNFSAVSEAAVNQHIMKELEAYYKYQSISSWLNRDDISLPGLAAYYYKAALGEIGHANKLISYMAIRGGRVVYKDIVSPGSEWESAHQILQTSLEIERTVNDSLLWLHGVANEENDAALAAWIEDEFLRSQNEQIKKAADLLTQLERCGNDGLGLYLFDKEIQKMVDSGEADEYEEDGDKKKGGY